jgi:hypothetical protein
MSKIVPEENVRACYFHWRIVKNLIDNYLEVRRNNLLACEHLGFDPYLGSCRVQYAHKRHGRDER